MGGRRSVLREYAEALLIAILFATFARAFVVQAFKIPSGSMEENLLIGDHLLVNKFVYSQPGSAVERFLLPYREVRRGDVVVFKFPVDPARDFIKRCVGLPGDTIRIVDKQLSINGEPVPEESYVFRDDPSVYPNSVFLDDRWRLRDNFGPYTVPDGHYFCLGDNRDNSEDSRYWGSVPQEYLKGRAFMIYWSFDGAAAATELAEPEGVLSRLATVASGFVRNTRWDRALQVVR